MTLRPYPIRSNDARESVNVRANPHVLSLQGAVANAMLPWIWILPCQPLELDIKEPTWFFINLNYESATAVSATTGKLTMHVPKKEICKGPHALLKPNDLGNQTNLSNVSYSRPGDVAGAMSIDDISTAS